MKNRGRRWSKLQKKLYNLMDESVDFQIHCAVYEMNSTDGWHGNKLPRYFVTIGKEIVFDWPKNFDTTKRYGRNSYPWDCDMSDISNVIEEYIQRPKDKLMEPFEKDEWGITDILRVCDRRIGKRRLKEIKENTDNEVLEKIIQMRLGENETTRNSN